MALLLSFIVLIVLAAANYYYTGRQIMQPSTVYAGIWSIQLAGLLFFSDKFIDPSTGVLFVIVLGVVMFSIGSHLNSISMHRPTGLMPFRVVRANFVVFLIVGIAVAFCLYNEYRIFNDLASSGDFVTALVFARHQFSYENEDLYGAYKYGNSLAITALLLLELIILKGNASLIEKLWFVYFFLVAFFMAILTTGRGPAALILLCLFLVYLLKGGITWRAVGLFVGLLPMIFLIFWIMGAAMEKAGEAVGGAMDDFVVYLFSPIPALSVYLDRNPITLIDGAGGENSFRFFFAVMAAVEGGARLPNLVQDFVNVPHAYNLYTTYLHYIKDFGLTGVFLVPVFLGYAHGYLFRSAMGNRDNDFAIFILAVSYQPLLQTIFQETHFLGMSAWIQYLAYGLIMTRMTSKKRGSS